MGCGHQITANPLGPKQACFVVIDPDKVYLLLLYI